MRGSLFWLTTFSRARVAHTPAIGGEVSTKLFASAATGVEKPKPQIFAIMRNAHEVIRGGMVDLQSVIDKDDMASAKTVWSDLSKFTEMHKHMEEGDGTDASPTGFFKVLDSKAGGLVSENGLFGLHEQLDDLEMQVDNAIEKGDMNSLKSAFPEFMAFNEQHLSKEEDVMMPSIQSMSEAGEPMKKYMVEEILPTAAESDDFEFFLKYANKMLEKHHGGMPRARVFDHALWAASTPAQWSVWSTWIEESLEDGKLYAEIQSFIEG